MRPTSSYETRRRSSRKKIVSTFRSCALSMSRAWRSKNFTSQTRASKGDTRTCTPPAAPRRRVWKRPIGSGACSRSATCTPALTMPLMSPRLSMRLERCWSRFIVIVAPSGSVDAYAAPRRATNSGVRSMFTMPVTPNRPKRARRPCAPQMRLEPTTAPDSICLSGQIFTCARTRAFSPTTEWSPTTVPSSRTTRDFRAHWRPTIVPCSSDRSPT